MAKPVILRGERHWPTRKAAEDHYRAILHKWPHGWEIDGAEGRDLMALVENHPEADQKIGCGVARFFTGPAEYGTSCFWLERLDGSRTDWSFKSALGGITKTLASRWRQAARDAVRPDILAFRDVVFSSDPRCAETGEPLTLETCHIDHTAPWTFERIVSGYTSARPFDYRSEVLERHGDMQFVTKFADDDVRARFVIYHNANATLRAVLASVNMAAAARRSA